MTPDLQTQLAHTIENIRLLREAAGRETDVGELDYIDRKIEMEEETEAEIRREMAS